MQYKLKDLAEIKFSLSSNRQVSDENNNAKLITPINLLRDNYISEITVNDQYQPNENTRVLNNDIILKRISPSFVSYISEVEEDVYAGKNLIIIRANKIDAKYLAYLLNKNISRMLDAYIGSSMPSIGRKDLEDFIIPMIPISEQIALGELWYLSTESKRMKIKLAGLEKIKTDFLLNDYIKKFGEINND